MEHHFISESLYQPRRAGILPTLTATNTFRQPFSDRRHFRQNTSCLMIHTGAEDGKTIVAPWEKDWPF
jgi:hypothetical protein